MKRKVLVIGLDCATFDLIKPYIREGWLPNLDRIMTQGVTRVLKSTVPPISPPAWTTFLTGKNPGRHGIFQFVDMDVRNYSFTSSRLINSSLFSGGTFIDFISEQKRKVGIVKIPFTYPPWKVNGFMVAGEPSPDWTKAHTYPLELSRQLGRVNMGSSLDFELYSIENLFKHLQFDCNARTRIACEMLQKEVYDFFMVVHNITDAAVHRFWKLTDKNCPNYRKSFRPYKNIIRDIYAEADKSIGEIVEKLSQDTTVFFMSDHGASRKPLHVFHINAWLKEGGYLVCRSKKSSSHYIHSMLVQMKNLLPPLLRHLIGNAIRAHFISKLSNLKTKVTNFDPDKTKAYAVNLYTTYDGIVLNLKGRQSHGIVEPGSDAEELCDRIRLALLEITDPRNGKKIIQQVYRREEIFKGEFSVRMPELIVQYKKDYRGGMDMMLPLFSDVPPRDFDYQSGDHDENGIFIASGPNIKKGIELPSAHIQDMAPTILYAMGLPVPNDMDGKILLDIFDNDFVEKNPVRKFGGKKRATSHVYELTEEEEDEMKEQLRGLGYM